MSKKHLAIVCNPLSGGGKPLSLLDRVTALLTKEQHTFNVFTGQLPETLLGYTDMIIMGGDGTINFTLNHFNDIEIPIGIIPCGTGNDVAYLLLGHLTLEQYVYKALTGNIQRVDAGSCNGKLFLNGAGIGFDGWVAKLMQGKKFLSGKAGYYLTVIRLLLWYKETPVELWIDEQPVNTSLFMLSVANGITYGGGFKVAPFAKINDGLLEVITVSKIGLLSRLRYLPVIEHGKHLNAPLPFIDYRKAHKITIKSNQPLQVHLDGEWMQHTELEIEVLPGKYLIRS